MKDLFFAIGDPGRASLELPDSQPARLADLATSSSPLRRCRG